MALIKVLKKYTLNFVRAPETKISSPVTPSDLEMQDYHFDFLLETT